MRCYYCGELAATEPYTDESGVGWVAICQKEGCRELAQFSAYMQRIALKKHGVRR